MPLDGVIRFTVWTVNVDVDVNVNDGTGVAQDMQCP